MILRKILEQLRKKLNVSAAEVEFQDLWQRSRIAVACVNTSSREANSTLSHAVNIIDGYYEAELLDHRLEIR